MSSETLMEVVQEQRSKLLNVLGAVQCMQVAVRHEPPKELEGAIELLEEELQRILEGLDQFTLYRALADRQDTPAGEEAS
jgi:hypothetical protein